MLRAIATCAMRGSLMSSVYVARPVMRRGSSRRLIRVPTVFGTIGMTSRCLSGARLRGGAPDRVHDVLVARAAAEVALEPVTDLRIGRVRVPLDQLTCGEDHARRAVAALEPVLFPEADLHRVELV